MVNDRKGFIGGSDIAAVMGLSRWTSALQLWAEKTGAVEPKDLSDIEAVILGTELEDFVAQKFSKKTGLSVRRSPKIYEHSEYPQFKCQVDRLIEKSDALLEVKTTSGWKAREWAGEEIPAEYILQVNWQLGITGRNTGWIAVLIGGQAFKYKKIDFDKGLFDKQIEMALAFWKCVEDKTPPMAVGIDSPFIIELNPTHDDTVREADEDVNASVALLQETKMHIDTLMETKDDVEAKLKQVIGSSLGIKTSKYVVTWKEQKRSSVDTEKMKTNGVYDEYKKESSTRVLRVRKGDDGLRADINSGK